MQVRFLRGYFYDTIFFAVSAFESLSVGEVTTLNSGVIVSGDCSWGETIIGDVR